ncbi:MAG: Asp23/Gls24 family envelope stress response protein [Clostridia bacterium]|nr:Asp23/Gls24 family envelope stress response protein [Oscillospiraceae bacterium]MBQ7032170.1 Asp23/Gls24 family envelope stress response protein [Clostridia bacterium]
MISIMHTDLGVVYMEESALAKMAGNIATKCYGVVGMVYRSKRDGIVSLLKRDKMGKGIQVTMTEKGLSVSLHIMVEYGVNISAVSESIVKNVKYQMKENAGLVISDVTVYVESIRAQGVK